MRCYSLGLDVSQSLMRLFQRWLDLKCVTDSWWDDKIKGAGIKSV